jgi:hypothetical protein
MRIVTRGDLDGLVAAVLLSEVEDVSEIALIHPQDITERRFEVTSDDILANLPYHPDCGMWFDHHRHTFLPEGEIFKGRYALEPSVARVIFDHYASDGKLAKYRSLVDETDRYDSANLDREDVLNPKGAILLGFIIDPRTGMGGDFREFFRSLVERLRERDVEDVLKDLDIKTRIAIYHDNSSKFHDMLLEHSDVDGNLVVTDFRKIENPPMGNRFIVYTTFPHCNVSMRIQWGPQRRFVAVNIGHSIFDRSCCTDVGALCREFGGGGHRGAGACSIEPENADIEIHEIMERLVEQD